MRELTAAAFKKASIDSIQKQLPITVTSGKKPVYKVVSATDAPAPAAQPTYTDDQLVKLVIGNDTDTVHIADAKKKISAWKGGMQPVTPPANTTTPSAPANTKTIDMTDPHWLGNWSGNVKDFVANHKPTNGDTVVLLVPYNIPGRDNGNYSSGGLHNAEEYAAWIEQIAQGIGASKALVVLEPDAIGLSVSLNETQRQARYAMLNAAAHRFRQQANTLVYIDSSMWLGVEKSVEMLKPMSSINGFSCNVSGYRSQQECLDYATAVYKATGLHAVIDTSRNGNGAPHGNMWCNQTDTKVGVKPTYDTKVEGIDAFLWIKVPGESDGLGINDDGSHPRSDVPAAGQMWPEARDALYSGDWSAFKQKYGI